MPNNNGMGPHNAGPMTGRARGACGGARAFGNGRGMGFGPQLSWFSAGYQDGDSERRGDGFRGALEQRAGYLRAELARTESLLQNSAGGADAVEGVTPTK